MGKDDLRIVALGDVDEASSFLGLARAEAEEEVGEAVDDAHGVGVLVCVSG